MISDGVITSVIGLLGGVLAAYITARFRRTKPKSEYIDTAFEAYEVIMRRQDEEIKRLIEENSTLRAKHQETIK